MEGKGIELITKERQQQVEEENWSPEHDDKHEEGDLALAAICYAAPCNLFVMVEHSTGFGFVDPWPESWCVDYDKRRDYGTERDVETAEGKLPAPGTYSDEERLDLLIKAGALIAAEIDRTLCKHGIDYERCRECDDFSCQEHPKLGPVPWCGVIDDEICEGSKLICPRRGLEEDEE